MKKFKIKNSDIQISLANEEYSYPKYTTQIINLANQNAQGTRPSVVGQMSDLIQEFDGTSLKEWEKWYLNKHPKSIEEATIKINKMVALLKEAILNIDEELVRKWVKELVIVKTYCGLKFQKAILEKVANEMNLSYKLSTPEDESKGIDGYIGEKPVSIKPDTYKSKPGLSEIIGVQIIYYDKKKDGIVVEYEPSDFY